MPELLPSFTFINVVPKVWGLEQWICNNRLYCAKILTVRRGAICSLHYHNKKDETFYVVSGSVNLKLLDKTFTMSEGMSVRIPPTAAHRFWVDKTAKEDAVIFEISTQHTEEDVVRIEDSRILA
jgi:mannose-6-phosphate isomerase-like protein (cupin superfamily)